jgi:glycosyltransferase involved in cell wall biosynthesis
MILSVVIPSYKDPLLIKTIDSLLANSELGDQLEIIAVLDGYWPSFELRGDPKVRYVHLGKNRGMRGAINAGVMVSKGEFIMRTDEHCIFGKGFDRILTETCQPDWIVTPRRYFLDPVKWEVMDIPPVDYMKLKIVNYGRGQKFSGVDWPSRAKEQKDIMLDETMAMQGSCWIMKRSWWDKVIGELQSEGYDTHYQDSHEMVFKTWQAGGKLMVNKNTWHAHKHRKFPRTHGYGGEKADKCFAYALSVWRDYYEKEISPKWRI